jgi:hypothetical protein
MSCQTVLLELAGGWKRSKLQACWERLAHYRLTDYENDVLFEKFNSAGRDFCQCHLGDRQPL